MCRNIFRGKNYYQLAEYNYAVSHIHFPKDKKDLLLGHHRLVFDEFLLFILSIRMMKEKTQDMPNSFAIKPVWETENVIDGLPYPLTNAQKRVWNEIERDMTGHTLMSRLVQGDVGSGKTIMAFLAMLLAAFNGYQAALMVPTEVLAKQHFKEMEKLLKEHQLPLKAVLLTGSNTAKEKRERCAQIASGEAKLIIGTHALIQEKVEYENLALVITDEQHRFGVQQREDLSKKGTRPHVLVMSATTRQFPEHWQYFMQSWTFLSWMSCQLKRFLKTVHPVDSLPHRPEPIILFKSRWRKDDRCVVSALW